MRTDSGARVFSSEEEHLEYETSMKYFEGKYKEYLEECVVLGYEPISFGEFSATIGWGEASKETRGVKISTHLGIF